MRIQLAATTDIVCDSRVRKIAGSLSAAGYELTVTGRVRGGQPSLKAPYQLAWLKCFAHRGMLFYAEFNLRLFWKLLWSTADVICSCDLDTLPACTLAAKLRRRKLVFDAHEYFEHSVEIVDKPWVRWVWRMVARTCIPQCHLCYTVSASLAQELSHVYHKPFLLIRNAPVLSKVPPPLDSREGREKVLWYQGAVNAGRGLEQVIDCLPQLPGFELHIAGEGDLSLALKALVERLGLQSRVRFLGRLPYEMLQSHASQAYIGLDLLDGRSKSYYYSLSNKAFDYIHAGLPSIQMRFPEYEALQREFSTGVLVDDLNRSTLIEAISTLDHPVRQTSCREQCLLARQHYHWGEEEKRLLEWFAGLFPGADDSSPPSRDRD
ncbi:MAG: glycosyltransferase [Saprospiraceae bacterium]|nr:glycosyltransferase [Saprospiraceae bacterium]